MASKAVKLKMIMEKIRKGDPRDPHNYRLWACRGTRRNCDKKVKKQKRCEDCMLCDDDDETLAHIQLRLRRGNA